MVNACVLTWAFPLSRVRVWRYLRADRKAHVFVCIYKQRRQYNLTPLKIDIWISKILSNKFRSASRI
nr:MAG TPA: hypothetical protein [Caudoviricetes sp.]